MTQKQQVAKPKNQHRSAAEASSRDTASEQSQSLTSPPFQLKASGETSESVTTQSPSSSYIVPSRTVTSSNERSLNGVSQQRKNPGAFQIPIQKKATTQFKKVAPFQLKASQSSSNGMPEDVRGKMESAFQTDFSNVNVHQNSQSATDVGALAYAQGNDVHFAPGQFKPNTTAGQELIGHELAHVVQQREGRVQPTTQTKGLAVNDNPSLENEADQFGKKAASGMQVPVQKKNAINPATSVLQGYFDRTYLLGNTTWRQADDLSVAVKVGYPNHILYAKSGKVASENAKLKKVSSGVELVETGEQETFLKGNYFLPDQSETLNRVEVKNKQNATEGDNMELYADCGKSNGVVVGGEDRQAVYNNPAGLESKAKGGPDSMKIQIMQEWLKEKEKTATPTEKAAIAKISTDTQKKDIILKQLIDKYSKATTKADKEKIGADYFAHLSDLGEIIWSFYNSLSKVEQEQIDKKIGINKFANPDTGQGFTTSTGGNPIPGQKTWNFHWGGVVMQSDDKKDKIVLENYAVGIPDKQNKKWEFAMYGTQKKGQTFHERHKATNQHGDAPTTMNIEKQ